jgi:hypothetical protein
MIVPSAVTGSSTTTPWPIRHPDCNVAPGRTCALHSTTLPVPRDASTDAPHRMRFLSASSMPFSACGGALSTANSSTTLFAPIVSGPNFADRTARGWMIVPLPIRIGKGPSSVASEQTTHPVRRVRKERALPVGGAGRAVAAVVMRIGGSIDANGGREMEGLTDSCAGTTHIGGSQRQLPYDVSSIGRRACSPLCLPACRSQHLAATATELAEGHAQRKSNGTEAIHSAPRSEIQDKQPGSADLHQAPRKGPNMIRRRTR